MSQAETLRKGFGEGLVSVGEQDDRVYALCADLTESTMMAEFASKFPDRFVEIGVAEQNLVTVASGLAAIGKIPFVTSYAAFSPGRNWEQIRTTICLNDQPVKIVGSHAGLSVGPDGATHQMLEDIALMRVLPNIDVVVPADYNQARLATIALARTGRPGYLRLAREKTIIIEPALDFELGRAQILRSGSDLSIFACGPMVAQALEVAKQLSSLQIDAEVINIHTIKPLDNQAIHQSIAKTGLGFSIEEGQIAGGMGSAIVEFLAENLPSRFTRIGVRDRFGQSGSVDQLWQEYGLSIEGIKEQILNIVREVR
ncbi:transketolase family protein [Candidatus Saccharibacteria bacterium]|nr:transketolase family protein [Candidatus Saccharibacteria bacterium]